MQLRKLAEHSRRVRQAVLVAVIAIVVFAGTGARVRADTPDGPDAPLIRAVSVSTTRVRPDQTIKVRIDVGDRWGIMDSPYIEYRKGGRRGRTGGFFQARVGWHS